MHPLVRQDEIPVRLANVFVYTPPPKKTKTKSKIGEKARVITSEKVRTEVASVEETKREKERAKRKSASGVVNPSFKCNTSFKYSHSGKGKKKLKKVGGASNSEEVEQHSSEQNTSFNAGDYVKVIKMPYKGYYATVIDHSVREKIEIMYFEKKGKHWKLDENDKAFRKPDEIERVPLSKVNFTLEGELLRSHVHVIYY